MDDDGEGQLAYLIAALDQATTAEKRVLALQSIKTYLDSEEIVSHTEPFEPLTTSLKAQLKNQNHLVSSLALAILPVYVSRIVSSSANASRAHDVKVLLHSVLPIVLEKLGDHKEKVRDGAKTAIVEIAAAAFAVSVGGAVSLKDPHSAVNMFERVLKESGLSAKSAKVKEQSILVLIPLRSAIAKLPLRPFLPSLVEHLSDADPGVREAARTSCINLFSSASATAKSELKKEMEKRLVRKQTADAILAQVLATAGASYDSDVPQEIAQRDGDSGARAQPSRSASRAGARPEAPADDGINAVYIASVWDLDRTVQAMLPSFEGKETEHNWLAREQSTIKLRGMLRTGVHETLYDGFLQSLKLLQEGILKATASLRTTLSMHALQLISELAKHMREGMDSIAEPLLTSIIKMAGFTKKIVASASQAAVRDIIVHVSYRHKFLDLIWQHLQEKTVTTRAFMCDHLVAILQAHGTHRKHLIESHGGLDIIDRFLKKALADQNKDVREKARLAFYIMEKIWPAPSAHLYSSLDGPTRKQVDTYRGQVSLTGTSTAIVPSGVVKADIAPSKRDSIASTTPRRAGQGAGPSSAIVAAKRAAAARLAQERREQEQAEEALRHGGGQGEADDKERELEASHAFEADSSRQLMDEIEGQDSPLSTPSKEASITFPPMPTPKSPLRRSQIGLNGSGQKRLNSPSSMPLPVSPRTSAADLEGAPHRSGSDITPSKSSSSSMITPSGHLLPASSASEGRARRTSTSSSSSARSVGRLSSTAAVSPAKQYQSFGQRVAQSASTPSRTRTSSTSSAPMSHRLSTSTSPSLRGRAISSTSSSHSLHPMSSNAEVDESLLLHHVPDASTDLLSDGATLESREGTASSRKQSATKRMSVSSSLSASSPSQFNQSIQRSSVSSPKISPLRGQSRLPRPVSMVYSSPPVLSPSRSAPSERIETVSRDESVSPVSPLSPTKRVPPLQAEALSNQPIKATSHAERGEEEARGTGTRASMTTTTAATTTTTSSAAVKWFLGKASRLDHAKLQSDEDEIDDIDLQLSPVKKRPESQVYISQLQSGQADVRTFKGLAKLCKDYKLPSYHGEGAGADDAYQSDNEVMLRPGRDNTTMSALGLLDASAEQSRREQEIAVTMWQQGNLFERLYAALSTYLCSDDKQDAGVKTQSKDLQTAALIVLHRLVENQFKLFDVQSLERDLLHLVFELTKRSKASNVKTACQAIMESWSEQTNIVVGISTLRGILAVYTGEALSAKNGTTHVGATEGNPSDSKIPPSSSSSVIPILTLSLRSLARLFQRLPVELIEEEVERCKNVLRTGLNHWNIETRQQAVAVLVAANGKIKDPKNLFAILQPMERSQEDLLMYYMSKGGG